MVSTRGGAKKHDCTNCLRRINSQNQTHEEVLLSAVVERSSLGRVDVGYGGTLQITQKESTTSIKTLPDVFTPGKHRKKKLVKIGTNSNCW